MSTGLIAVIVILLAGFAALAMYLKALAAKLEDMKQGAANDKGLIMLNQNMNAMTEKLDKTSDTINERLTNAAKVISAVQKELGTVQERFKGFEEFNELLHPKMRGGIGEEILADMLGQFFAAEHYDLQWKFKGGETVDAIIRTQAGVIPIDSKFPLENFRALTRATNDSEKASANKLFVKDVKKHINDIAKKYIRPDEGTLNFAVMYIPSENIYYHIMTDESEGDLLGHAKKQNIMVVSPHSFFNFIRVVMMGLERGKLQEQAQKIWDILKGVQSESIKFGETMGVLNRHITNAKSAMDTTQAGYDKLNGKLEAVKLLE